jgi:hypothetical protein
MIGDMPTPNTPVDLDALLADDIAAVIKATKWNKIKLFDKTWRITTEPNVFASLAGSYGDVEALVSIIKNVVHPDEREEFHRTLLGADGINAEVLMKLLNHLVEAAAERPTTSPSGSSRASGKTQAVRRKSAGT